MTGLFSAEFVEILQNLDRIFYFVQFYSMWSLEVKEDLALNGDVLATVSSDS